MPDPCTTQILSCMVTLLCVGEDGRRGKGVRRGKKKREKRRGKEKEKKKIKKEKVLQSSCQDSGTFMFLVDADA